MTHHCYACRLTMEPESCPGGTLLATELWVVQHCTGPLPLGTLIVKPLRHVIHISELSAQEAEELGPLLRRVSAAVHTLCKADQVYVCAWGHRSWTANHVHFVVQPAWNAQSEQFDMPGPSLQARQLESGEPPPPPEVVAWCDEARQLLEMPATDSPVVH